MEWTDSAEQEIESILESLGASLNPQEVDPDEVMDDIRNRMVDELKDNGSVVTADHVRAAAAKIGVQDIPADTNGADPAKAAFEKGLHKPRRIRSRIGTGWFWFAGILLPLVTLGIEAITHICLEAGLADPLPTPFHTLLIALVPTSNLLGWLVLKKNKAIPAKWLGLLSGMAVAISAYYALMFAAVTPFAIIGFAAIIYFGIGLLCFLPLSPLLSLLAALRMRVLLKRQFQQRLPFLWTGMAAGFAAIILFSAPMYLTKIGLTMAASGQPETQIKGIKLLRRAGDEVIMNRACYWGANMPSDPISWLINRGQRIDPTQARNIYYRVTGHAFNTKASPTLGLRTRRNPGDEFDWDPEQGGDVVAGRLKGLSMTDSRMDGTINTDAATAYLEWTMVFHNDWRNQREARAQIALPPGAVVSRLTLWIDGEEREAAFGGRSQVKQAYKKVVRRRRDPVLVTTCGPDRVLMQCFPVPVNGDMKIRIGITAPLATPSETGRELRLPYLYERNFRIPENVRHAVWIENGLTGDLTDAELNSPATTIHTESSMLACWAKNDGTAVLQEIKSGAGWKPDRITLVIDSSACMAEYLDDIGTALDAFPSSLPATVIIAGDEPVLYESIPDVRRLDVQGGMDSSAALRKALTLATPGGSNCVVWIHGPQSWSLNSGENLRQALERQNRVRLYDFQVGHGPHRLVEKLDNLAGIHTAARGNDIATDLANLFDSFTAESKTWKAVRSSIDHGDPAVHQTDDHLVRLYALDRIHADLSDHAPGNDEALRLALKHHLVTPVSGAVVLETQEQYDEANLKPVDSRNVPSVPEPGTLILLMFAALAIFYGQRIVRRFKFKLEFRG